MAKFVFQEGNDKVSVCYNRHNDGTRFKVGSTFAVKGPKGTLVGQKYVSSTLTYQLTFYETPSPAQCTVVADCVPFGLACQDLDDRVVLGAAQACASRAFPVSARAAPWRCLCVALPAACRAGAECAVQPLANREVWDAAYWAKQAVPALRADVGSTLGVLAMDVGLPQEARAATESGGTSLVTVKLKVLARDAMAVAFIFKKFKARVVVCLQDRSPPP